MTTQPKYFVYYHYYPSLAAAIVAIVLFALTTIAHTFQLVKTRTWYLIPFVVGGICELALGECLFATDASFQLRL